MIPALATLLATLGALVGYRPPPLPQPPQIQPPAPQVPQEPSDPPAKGITPGKRTYPPLVERWRGLATTNGRTWDPDDVLFVIDCESDGDERSVGIGGRGLMGVQGGPLEAEPSMAWAYHMWEQWGWSRWAPVCRPR